MKVVCPAGDAVPGDTVVFSTDGTKTVVEVAGAAESADDGCGAAVADGISVTIDGGSVVCPEVRTAHAPDRTMIKTIQTDDIHVSPAD
jgi:hypothetical protein